MVETYRAEYGHCRMRSSPLPTIEQVERELIRHFTECHPERLASLRARIQAGKLTVVRREPTW